MPAKTFDILLTAGFFSLAFALPVHEAAAQDSDDMQENSNQLEFRAVVTVGDVSYYSLHDPETEMSFWVSDDEVQNEVEVVDFSEEEKSLTLYVGSELQEVTLSHSKILDVSDRQPERRDRGDRRDRRRRQREERRARVQEFRENWAQATQQSAELQQLNGQLQTLAEDFRDTRRQRRRADRGTDERDALRDQERSISRELRLMAEYTALHAHQNTSYGNETDLDADRTARMARWMAFRSTDDDDD